MNRLIVTAFFLITIAPALAFSGQIGTKAPSFVLADSNGAMITLEHYKGKVVFLDFWAPWCIPCRQELPELDALYKKYGSDRFEVIAVSMDPFEKNTAAFLRKFPLSIHVVIDTRNEVSDIYRVTSLPTGFIIGRDGVIKYQHKGFNSEDRAVYEKEIDELL